MSLITATLETEFKKFAAKDDALFVDFPSSIPVAADDWASAVNTYASAIVPPSTTTAAAKSAMEAVLLGVDVNLGNGVTLIPNAFAAYALALAGGMAPAYTGTPPPAPLVLDSVWVLGLSGGSGADCIALMATIVDAWFRTGLATATTPPYVVIPWS